MSFNNPQKTFERAQRYHKQGKLDDAFKLYKDLHKSLPYEITFVNLLGQISLEKNKYASGTIEFKITPDGEMIFSELEGCLYIKQH